VRFLEDFKLTLPNLPGALCADPSIPSDVFHPEGNAELLAVLPMVVKLCSKCPERAACLKYAVDEQIFDGLWAGTTGTERRLMGTNQGKRSQGKKVSEWQEKKTNANKSKKQSRSLESPR